MTNEINSGIRKLPGIGYESYKTDIDAALQRRNEKGLVLQSKEYSKLLEEQLLAGRVDKLAVIMKPPIEPYVAELVDVGEKLIKKKLIGN